MKYLILSFLLLTNTHLLAQSALNNCLHFNGKQSVVGPFTTTSETFCITFSFKTTSVLPGSQGMSRMLCWNNNDQSRIEFGLIDGELAGFFYDLSTHSTAEVLRSNVFVADGKWHHVTLISRPDRAEWFLDDQIVYRLGGPLTPGNSLRLGAWYSGEYFTGCLDNVRLYTLPGTAPVAEYTFEQGSAGGDNRQLTTLTDATAQFPLQLNGFALQGATANFVDAAAPLITPAPPTRQLPVHLPPPDGKNGPLCAKQFATLDGNLLLFTPGEEDLLQMDFIGLVSQKINNEGFPISDRAFIEIDTIEVIPEELEDYHRQSVRRLKKQSDAAFWQQLSGGAFMYRDDDQQLQLFEMGSPHRAISANYRPLALSLSHFTEADETARFIQQNEPLLFHDGFQQWLTDDYETYTVVLLHLNKNIPFALLFDEKDGEYCGYIIVTSEGPQLGLTDRCTGVHCGWKFVKMPQPQYAKWALRENWRLSEQFDTIQNGAYLSVQNARTGQILVPSAKSVDMYPSCLAVQLPDGQYHLYDGLGRLVYPRGKNDPAIRALDARWASGAGIRVLVGNQFYWWTLTGGIRADEHPPLPVVEMCGTVDYYTDSLIQTAGQWEIRCRKEGIATAARSETYVLPAQSHDQVAYVNYSFLNGEPVLRYYSGYYWYDGDMNAALYQPVIARRADQQYDLLRLETGPNRLLQKTILLERTDWVQNMGYNALLLFKKNGLLGIFPGMTEGELAEIQPFEYFFARITMPNGRKGWVNMKGEIYLDE